VSRRQAGTDSKREGRREKRAGRREKEEGRRDRKKEKAEEGRSCTYVKKLEALTDHVRI